MENLQRQGFERIQRGLEQGYEKAKAECEKYIEKCAEIARKASRKLEELDKPGHDITFKKFHESRISLLELAEEFRKILNEVYRALGKVPDKHYKVSVGQYIHKLNEVIRLSEKELSLFS